jgi:hypothetical protein
MYHRILEYSTHTHTLGYSCLRECILCKYSLFLLPTWSKNKVSRKTALCTYTCTLVKSNYTMCVCLHRTVRQSIQQQRSHQAQLDGLPQCSCCEVRLGKVFKNGALCPRCGHRVCKTCRTLQSPPPPKFICTVCERQR